MRTRLFAAIIMLLAAPKSSFAGLYDLESLIKIPAPTKYFQAVNSAKSAAIKQSGLADIYKNYVRSVSKNYKEKALSTIEQHTGFDPRLTASVVGVTSTVFINKAIELNMRADGISYKLYVRQQLFVTGVEFSF